MKTILYITKAFFILVILSILYVSFLLIQDDIQLDKTTLNSNVSNIESLDTFSLSSFRNKISVEGIKHGDIVYRQAILESGWFTSNIWKKNNNPFGFYYKGKYLVFDSWQKSVEYYSRWQKRHYKSGDYYEFLDSFYASDTLYIIKLKQIDIK